MNQAINDCLAVWNSMGKTFCGYAAGAFVQSALLVILLLAIDLLLRRRVRAVLRYGVWLLVLVKLLLPPTLSLPTGIGYWIGHRLPVPSPTAEPISIATEYEPVKTPRYVGPESSGGIPRDHSPSNIPQPGTPLLRVALSWTPVTWQAIVLLLWLVGVLAFTALLAQRIRFIRGRVAASTPADGALLDLLEECRRRLDVRRPASGGAADAGYAARSRRLRPVPAHHLDADNARGETCARRTPGGPDSRTRPYQEGGPVDQCAADVPAGGLLLQSLRVAGQCQDPSSLRGSGG